MQIIKINDDTGAWVVIATHTLGIYHDGACLFDIINAKYKFIYVSTSGSDENDGSYNNPFLTSAKAIEVSLNYTDSFIVTDGVSVAVGDNYKVINWEKI